MAAPAVESAPPAGEFTHGIGLPSVSVSDERPAPPPMMLTYSLLAATCAGWARTEVICISRRKKKNIGNQNQNQSQNQSQACKSKQYFYKKYVIGKIFS
jgi:hypothetical protein